MTAPGTNAETAELHAAPDTAVAFRGCRLDLAADVRLLLDAWSVAPASQVAITGPSGCGKSSLLHLISGLLKPSAGEVEVFGKNLGSMSARARDRFRGREMGIIYQTFNLLPHFSPRENVKIGMRFGRAVAKADRKARADAVLETVGLSHRANHRVGTLSIGEQQRVAIARAIANEPRLILADEPTGSLDPENGRKVFTLLQQLAEQTQATLIVVTHDLELARELPQQFDARELVQ